MKNKITLYRDLIDIKVKECNEPFVEVRYDDVMFEYQDESKELNSLLNWKMILRERIRNMLIKVNSLLKEKSWNDSLEICILCWYRCFDIQKKLSNEVKIIELKKWIFRGNSIDLFEKVHTKIAVPEVAGHPTWWAVDVAIYDKSEKKFLDFWTGLIDFSTDECFTFSDNISKEAMENRVLLRNVMMEIWFAPYDWEWWHYSYWDVEWAYFYGEEESVYSQKVLEEVRL